MNDRQFEDALRAAMPAPTEPPTLDAKIDRALAMKNQLRPAPRRFALGFALTAAVAAALVVVPARQAQASLGSILSALEASGRVRIVQYAVGADGRRIADRTIDVDGADQHAYSPKQGLDEYGVGDRRLAFHPFLKAFVETPRAVAGGSILKVRFVPGNGEYAGMDTHVERVGRADGEVLRATVTSRDGGVRFVIDASPATRRPLDGSQQVLERGAWRTVRTTRFVYDAPFRVAPPAPGRVPRLTPAEADAAYRRALSEGELAQAPLGAARLVVRKVDVAADGTVFVAFQRGVDSQRGFRGYTLRLTDDLGTEYARVGQTYERAFDRAPSSDGPFAMEVFAPREPVSPWAPRTLRFQAHRFANGAWAGTLERVQTDADGTPRPWPGILMTGAGETDPQPLDLPAFRVPRPTCADAPGWAAIFSPGEFGAAFLTATTKTEARAKLALDYRRWDDAERLLSEALDRKRESERLGYGPSSLEATRRDLTAARAARRP